MTSEKSFFIKAFKPFYFSLKKMIDSSFFLRKVNYTITKFLCYLGIPNRLYSSTQHAYWESRGMDTHHSPTIYTKPDESTYVLLDGLIKSCPKDTSFLEVGCNAGRNLHYLYENGYRKLAGIDINRPAIETCLKETFPELYKQGTFYVGNAAKTIKNFKTESYDVVFSNAVLIHIHPNSRSLFADMVRVSKKYIAIFVTKNPSSAWPYDFVDVFKKLDCELVEYKFFYGENKVKYQLPNELFEEKKHFFDETMIAIFVKKKN